jgi:hypothetical protein
MKMFNFPSIKFCQKWSCRQEPPLCVRKSNFAHKALKCSSDITFLYQFIPRPLLLRESIFLSKVELQTGTPSECAEFKCCSQGSKMLLRTFLSFSHLFPDLSFYEKVDLCQKWSCRREPPFFVRNLVLACSSLHYLLHCTFVHYLASSYP